MEDGLGTLADGTGTAYSGSEELSSGLDTLAASVDGMDQKVLDQVQQAIDERLGTGYALHSFVDPSNSNVKDVQFVYVVSGVKKDDSSNKGKDDDSSSTQDESFTQRLTDLFSNKGKDE